MMKGKKFIYAKMFEGFPTFANFKLEEFEVPEIKNGEILCSAEYLSVDPYMRPYMLRYPVGTTMIGGQIARIIDSKSSEYPIGSFLFGQFGWQTHNVYNTINNDDQDPMRPKPYLLPEFGNIPRSLGLGYLGMPGNTAYFGFLEICQPKSGETVVVTAAAGAVGSLVGQIAKIKGCHVIGFAGTDEKCKWLINDLGFDHAINYKTENLVESLKKAAPNGVDCYFDNVGGDLSSIIINQMNLYGRISVCGSISSYNEKNMPKSAILQPNFIFKQLKMEGFLVYRWLDRYMEGITKILSWIKEGKIKYNETITNNFENMPEAFMDMLNGKNIGKAIVKV